MASNTVYPYGTGGQMPSGIPLINDLITGGADKALAAEQGVVLNNKIADLAQRLSQMMPEVEETGWFLVDGELNVAMRYDADGFDAAKVSDHFKSLVGGGYTLPVASPTSLGGVKVGSGLSIDASGVLSASGGGGGGNFIETVEDGFFIVDQSLNIGVYVDANGIHANNILEFQIVNM